jgi:hypothetical protein
MGSQKLARWRAVNANGTPNSRPPGDDARDVIALIAAVDQDDCEGMAAILRNADQLGLTVGLAVLSAHLLREMHGDDISYWLASHRRAALAMDEA